MHVGSSPKARGERIDQGSGDFVEGDVRHSEGGLYNSGAAFLAARLQCIIAWDTVAGRIARLALVKELLLRRRLSRLFYATQINTTVGSLQRNQACAKYADGHCMEAVAMLQL